jgi:tetratricopeptide (TPR) repeat protein
MNRRKRRAAANNASGASTPDALFARGLACLQRGQLLDAQMCCQDALALDATHADTLYLMGLLAIETDHCDHAVDWLARAISRIAKVEYVSALGRVLQRLGRLDEATKAFDKVLQLKPADAQDWKNLANVLSESQRADEAVVAWRHALQLDPHDAEAVERCGTLLLDLERFEDALACFDRCDELRSSRASVLEKRAHALHRLGRPDEALAEHRRAYALDPDNPNICNNIGASLQSQRQHDDALVWFDLAIALKPGFAMALLNKALSLTQLGRIDAALAALNDAKAIDPDNAEIAWNLSLLQLMTGDFEVGWGGREVRWNGSMRSASYPAFSQPIWRGDIDIAGKTVLVAEDEGLGDTIQFARYLPMLAARDARVILLVRDALHPLLSGLSGLSQCLPKSAGSLPQFDLHCPICSLPMAFGTRLDTIPSVIPYLPAPSPSRVQAWKERLASRTSGRLRVGLVWSGNPQHGNDHNRSIPLQTLSRLLTADADVVSLQKDLRPGDATLLEQAGIVDLTVHLTDFAETAALLACLDLVITVDTSVAHLAGALGRPTWVLLPHVPDYRWLLERDDSPWYPTMRLFRQDERRDWEAVIDVVRDELASLIATQA